MPNWSYNAICLQGKKEAVHQLIRIGLKKSHLESTDDIRKDWKLLCNEGKTKTNSNIDNHKEKGEIEMDKWLSARTFLPAPDTFLLYDTTNCPDLFPEAVKEQKEKYGVVGWYDYNILTLGTKWNFGIGNDGDDKESFLKELDNGNWRIVFDCQTAWSMPTVWLIAMKDLVPELFVGIMAREESGEYFCVSYVEDNELVDYEDFTPEWNVMCDEWNTNREDMENEIRSDKSKMNELREKVKSENPNIKDDEIEDEIDYKIQFMIDEEYGESVDEGGTLLYEMGECFTQMMHENLS